MKQRIFTLVILLAVSFLGAIDAELTEVGFIDSDFDATLNYLDINDILNLYKFSYSNAQQFLVKRLHIDGTEEGEQLLYDFSDASDSGHSFWYHSALHRPTPEGGAYFFLFYNHQDLVLLKHEGNQLQAWTLLFSSLDNFNSFYDEILPAFIFLDESILIHGENNDSESCLWEWNFETGASSLYYTLPDLFTDPNPYNPTVPFVTKMGENIVISKSAYPDLDPPYQRLPIMVLDSSLNSTMYYEHIAAISTIYTFGDNTYFASWRDFSDCACKGVLFLYGAVFNTQTWVADDPVYPGGSNVNISFRLANSIFGVWHSHSSYDYPITYRFYLTQLQADGSMENYTGPPELVNTSNNYDYALNLQGRLLLANYDDGIYTFQLADFDEGEFANWPEGDTWQPDLEGYTLFDNRCFSNADYAVFRMTLEDDSASRFHRYYFLNLEHRVSVDDLVQSPSSLKAYPNPFTDYVQISSSKLPEADDIHIYNLKGQKVKTFKATCADYIWNGCDDSGNKLGAGIYFLKGSVKERAVKIIKLK
jgi:hypothetical protein